MTFCELRQTYCFVEFPSLNFQSLLSHHHLQKEPHHVNNKYRSVIPVKNLIQLCIRIYKVLTPIYTPPLFPILPSFCFSFVPYFALIPCRFSCLIPCPALTPCLVFIPCLSLRLWPALSPPTLVTGFLLNIKPSTHPHR